MKTEQTTAIEKTGSKIEQDIIKDPTKQNSASKIPEAETKAEDKKVEENKKPEKKIEVKPKKTEAAVNAHLIPVSTKKAIAVCKAISGMTPEAAVSYLEQVAAMRKAVPMKGEIPHRKGNIMSGRFPIKTAKEFIRLVKSLSANANNLGISNPIITEAISNRAPRPYGRFGAVRRKRTHITLKARQKEAKKK